MSNDSISVNYPQKVEDLPIRQRAFKILIDNNLDPKQAGKLLSYKEKSVRDVKSKLSRYRLTTPGLLKKGKAATTKMLDDYLSGKGRPADVLPLILRQQDHVEPVVKHQKNLNINADLGLIDLSDVE